MTGARPERFAPPVQLLPTVVVVPVLGRPHRVEPLVATFLEHTPCLGTLIFVADAGDHAEHVPLAAAAEEHDVVRWITVPDGTPYGAKINAGIRESDEPVIFQAADDLLCHDEWIERAQTHLGGRIHVVGTNDLYNPRVKAGKHSTHSLVTRRYVETCGTVDELGKMMHEYPHEYCDDEFVQTARYRRAFSHAKDSIVEHLHPYAGKAEFDWVYEKGRSLREASQRIYEERRRLWTSGL